MCKYLFISVFDLVKVIATINNSLRTIYNRNVQAFEWSNVLNGSDGCRR